MSETVPEAIKEGAAALPMVSRYFPVVVAIAALFGVGLLVWRDEKRADAQIAVLQRMADDLGGLRQDFQVAGIRVTTRRASAARDPE